MGAWMLKAAVMLLTFTWVTSPSDVVSNCKVIVTQPQYIEADAPSRNATIPCTFSMEECSSRPTTLWFRYFTHSHEDLCTPICANSAKFGTDFSSLQIKDVGEGDIAVYFCGVSFQNPLSPNSEQVGGGTTLMLRGREKYNQWINIMMATVVLLLLYLIAILITLKFLSKPKVKNAEHGGLKAQRVCVRSKEKREAVGRAIAQELCKKKKGRRKRTDRLDKALPKR